MKTEPVSIRTLIRPLRGAVATIAPRQARSAAESSDDLVRGLAAPVLPKSTMRRSHETRVSTTRACNRQKRQTNLCAPAPMKNVGIDDYGAAGLSAGLRI